MERWFLASKKKEGKKSPPTKHESNLPSEYVFNVLQPNDAILQWKWKSADATPLQLIFPEFLYIIKWYGNKNIIF